MRGGVHSFFAEFAMGGERGGYPVVYKEIAPDKPIRCCPVCYFLFKVGEEVGFWFK